MGHLRVRVENSIAAWDDKALDVNSVFMPADDVLGLLDHMEQTIELAGLHKLDHRFLDGGVLIRFRRKHDADVFRQLIHQVTPK